MRERGCSTHGRRVPYEPLKGLRMGGKPVQDLAGITTQIEGQHRVFSQFHKKHRKATSAATTPETLNQTLWAKIGLELASRAQWARQV